MEEIQFREEVNKENVSIKEVVETLDKTISSLKKTLARFEKGRHKLLVLRSSRYYDGGTDTIPARYVMKILDNLREGR